MSYDTWVRLWRITFVPLNLLAMFSFALQVRDDTRTYGQVIFYCLCAFGFLWAFNAHILLRCPRCDGPLKLIVAAKMIHRCKQCHLRFVVKGKSYEVFQPDGSKVE